MKFFFDPFRLYKIRTYRIPHLKQFIIKKNGFWGEICLGEPENFLYGIFLQPASIWWLPFGNSSDGNFALDNQTKNLWENDFPKLRSTYASVQ